MRKLALIVVMFIASSAFCDQVIYDQWGNAKVYSDNGEVTQVQPTYNGGYNVYQPNGQVDQAIPINTGYNIYQGTNFENPSDKTQELYEKFRDQLNKNSDDN